MAAILRITSRANPRVKAVVALRTRRGRDRSGRLIAEGTREIERALAAGLILRELYACPQQARRGAIDIEAWLARASAVAAGAESAPTARHIEVNRSVLTAIAYQENPEGVVAVFDQPTPRPADATRGAAGLWLVASGASKPGNVGAMARSASAAGATALLLADSVVDIWNPNAIRASTGAVFSLPILAADGPALLAFLQTRAAHIVAADPAAPRRYTDVDMTGPSALVVGAEDRGLDDTWRAAAEDRVVCIPQAAGAVDSLNAAAVAAVLLFEAVRQRSTPPS